MPPSSGRSAFITDFWYQGSILAGPGPKGVHLSLCLTHCLWKLFDPFILPSEQMATKTLYLPECYVRTCQTLQTHEHLTTSDLDQYNDVITDTPH